MIPRDVGVRRSIGIPWDIGIPRGRLVGEVGEERALGFMAEMAMRHVVGSRLTAGTHKEPWSYIGMGWHTASTGHKHTWLSTSSPWYVGSIR